MGQSLAPRVGRVPNRGKASRGHDTRGDARVRSRTASDGGGRCPQCALHKSACACSLLPRLPIQTRFLVVRHAREANKSSNTARWAALLLPSVELLGWSGRQDVGNLRDVGRPGDWLLFPSEPSRSPTVAAAPPPERLVVLDGTWRQVRRMLSALPALQALPRLSVPARPDRVGLRRAPSPRHLSTLEAMSSAVALLEGETLATALDVCHRELVSRALRARGRRLPEAA
jgi:DTW domain-containing protein